MMTGQVLYAQCSGAYIAYETIGSGPRDILVVMDGFISIDAMRDEPRLARAMAALNSFGRLIRFDCRGVGLSDPIAPNDPPTLEQQVEDAIAVLDAVGSERAVILASYITSPVGLLIAATRPERVDSLLVVNAYARMYRDVDYPAWDPTQAALRLGVHRGAERGTRCRLSPVVGGDRPPWREPSNRTRTAPRSPGE
jgi:pimeloyl-ACP methyl ester carboxylesterase